MTHWADRVAQAVAARRTPGVVGLDPLLERLPAELRPSRATQADCAAALRAFGEGVLDAVAPHVGLVKINSAFFEAFGPAGVEAYFTLVASAHRRGLLVIGDIKRGDIGSTSQRYAAGHVAEPACVACDPQRVPDAVTVAGYLGQSAVRPFADAAAARGGGVFVLVRPSDPGADEVHEFGGATPFYMHMAQLVRRWGEREGLRNASGFSNVGAVVAPKDPESTRRLRAALPGTIFLVPGYGAQGASAEDCRACFLPGGGGALVNASRSVIFAHELPQMQARFGDDWRACVEAACREFAADLATLL